MHFPNCRSLAWIACMIMAMQVCYGPACGQGQPAAPQLTKDQDRLARDFLRGKAAASEEAKQALALKVRMEVERLRPRTRALLKRRRTWPS